MVEIKAGGAHIFLYDSIQELPSDRYHEFTKYVLLDLGVGTDMQSIADHNKKVDTYLLHGKVKEAIQQRKTQDLAYWYAINAISFKSYCFAVMVYRINNEYLKDITLDSLDQTLSKLTKIGVKESDVSDTVESIKKNLIQSFDFAFLNDLLMMSSPTPQT